MSFLLRVRVTPGREEDFLERYDALAQRIEQGLAGHVVHELCQSTEEPDRWVIASRWETLEASQGWERSAEHRELTMRLRECWDEAERSAYIVRAESRRREEEP